MPSGISIFFCTETKSLNAAELEKECTSALVYKIKAGDIDKLSKQKLYLPSTVMDLVWMTQNFCSIISLCFCALSMFTTFLNNWANHMYENRLMYTSRQYSDPYFFARVLFTIDESLQIHWCSCSNTDDRLSVTDRILLMNDTQGSILTTSKIN